MPSSPSLSPWLNHRRLIDELGPRLAFAGGDVAAWQERSRPKVRELLGLPQIELPPLEAKILWRRKTELGTIEKVVFTCEPGAEAVAFLCLPREISKPVPAFICLQGHTSGAHNSIAVDREDNAQEIEVREDYDFGLGCLRRGVAAFCLEQRAFGERRERHLERRADHGCQDAAMHALMLGRTLAGERVFDVERAIDYLATRPEIDLTRLGVMGNSGGGTVAIYAAALSSRLAYAMPSCCFCTYRDSILSIRHCVDNYVPGLLTWAEMADVAGLLAPRPLVVVAGEQDAIFPIEATRRAFEALHRIYRAAGAEENCRLVVGPGGHRFYAEPAWAEMLPRV